jgi:histidyl-tRNA synthetase
VAVLATFFRRVGLDPSIVLILVNNRRLMDSRFENLGINKQQRPAVSSWIDRREKMAPDGWEAYGGEIGLSGPQIANLKNMLEDKELWRESPELIRFFAAADVLGISDYVRFEPSIMRGLQYYTGTVFEAWEVGGDIRRSVLGGGRYDNLLTDIGGAALPAVGFAMGDVVITLMLEKYRLLPKGLSAQPASVLVTVFDQERLLDSYRIATELRRAGIATALYPEPAKLPRQLKYADRMSARLALVIGPDEAAKGLATLKDLSSGVQQTVEQTALVAVVRQILESAPSR